MKEGTDYTCDQGVHIVILLYKLYKYSINIIKIYNINII